MFVITWSFVGLHISWCEVLPCKVYTSSWLILPSQFQAQFQFRFQSEVLFSIWAEEVEAGLGVLERQFHTRAVHDPKSGWVGPGGARFIRNERNSQGTESLSGPNSRFWIPKWDWGHLDKSWVVPVPICTRINAPEKSLRKIHITYLQIALFSAWIILSHQSLMNQEWRLWAMSTDYIFIYYIYIWLGVW